MMRRNLVACIALLLIAAALPTAAFADVAAVQKAVDDILSRPSFAGGIHGCVIKTADTNRVVYSKNPDTLLMTASNLKLLTSAAALDGLGPNFRFETVLAVEGPVDGQGVVHGSAALIGSGDPVFDVEGLRALVDEAKRKGVRRIEGDIIGDPGNFDETPYGTGWSWDYLEDYYAAPAGGLNFHKNMVDIAAKPGAGSGHRAELSFSPLDMPFRYVNAVTTVAAGGRTAIYREREPGTSLVRISGTVALDAKPEDGRTGIAVVDPALYAASVLKQEMEAAGITVTGRARTGKAPSGSAALAKHLSDPLSSILVSLNKWSDNLIAECLLRTLGSVKGERGSISEGRRAAYEFFGTRAGMDTDAVHMADGSGLSRMNLMTCSNFVELLGHMRQHDSSRIFIESLPIAGVDGTLRNRMKGTPAEGNARAKTGYIGNVSSLSGYVTTAAGQPMLFSILFNHQLGTVTPCRQAQDDICALLAGCAEKL